MKWTRNTAASRRQKSLPVAEQACPGAHVYEVVSVRIESCKAAVNETMKLFSFFRPSLQVCEPVCYRQHSARSREAAVEHCLQL